MNGDAAAWLRYAQENRQAAELCIDDGLLNPALQNIQQAVEKALKAVCMHVGLPIRKTHSIAGLRLALLQSGIDCRLDEEECNLLDAIYLPSKYPMASVLPDFEPDVAIASQCLAIADRVLDFSLLFCRQPGT